MPIAQRRISIMSSEIKNPEDVFIDKVTYTFKFIFNKEDASLNKKTTKKLSSETLTSLIQNQVDIYEEKQEPFAVKNPL